MSDYRLEATNWSEAFDHLPPQVSPRQVAEIGKALKADLRTALAGLDGDLGIKVTRYNIGKALTCPASAADTPFMPNAVLTSREIGLQAIEARPPSSSLLDSVNTTIATAINDAHWTAGFLTGQDDASRAATVAYALGWASRALSGAPAHVFRDGAFEQKPTYFSPLGYGSPVALVGRPDLVLRRPQGQGPGALLLSFAWPDAISAALDALVRALKIGVAPLRCLISYVPGGSLHRLDIDADALRQISADVVQAVAALAPFHRGEPLFADPGPSCWNCDFRIDCPTGQRWAESQPPRRGGLPI